MASGSGPPGNAHGSLTDPRPRDRLRSRGLLYRSNLSDEQMNSIGLEDRPNNWDFSEWRPSDVFDSKRIKKENPEKERDKAKEKSLKQESPPDASRRKHTPATYPRTRVSAATPMVERRSLERLRTQLQFSDQDEVSQTGSERNNERISSASYERFKKMYDDTVAEHERSKTGFQSLSGNRLVIQPGTPPWLAEAQDSARREEQNNHRSQPQSTNETPDSNQLVSRLMQVRDYIKQAMQMMDRLRVSPAVDQESLNKARKLSQVIEQLREQEQNYMDFLMKVLSSEEAALLDDGSSKADNEVNDETSSADVDGQSEISEATTESNQPPAEQDGYMESKNRELEMLSDDQRRIHDIIAGEHQAAMAEKKSELEALRQQRDLLKNMLAQQRQLRDLQGRQVALLQQQRESHLGLQQVKHDDDSVLEASAGATDDAESMDSDTLAKQLSELKSQLDYARNMYTSQPDKSTESKSREELDVISETSSVSSAEQKKLQLLDKLRSLQSEKDRMDDLLNELKIMRESKFMQLNNDLDGSDQGSATNSVTKMRAGKQAVHSAESTIQDANHVLDLLDAQSKVKELEAVRNRLSQLKDLVQYYESGTRFIHDEDGDEDDARLPPAMPELDVRREDLQSRREALNELKSSGGSGQTTAPLVRPSPDDDNCSDINFSLGPFQNDPEIIAQVSKLRSAKQRLKRLKDMVENMPSMEDATAMVDQISQLNASLDAGPSSGVGGASGTGVVSQTGAVVKEAEGDDVGEAAYQAKVEEQKAELRQLMQERKRLLGVQEQLQKLYERLPATTELTQGLEAEVAKPNIRAGKNKDTRKVAQRESVTFQDPPEVDSSNDELYNRMRSQRILREELRSRKRELEAIMRKGDLRKPYNRLNHDNQSDNISYSNKSSDAFGFGNLSADVTTMATWGGSSEQNLEGYKNSTHSNSTSDNDEDDGYPSDGILQVEEEEEEEAEGSDANTYTVEDDGSNDEEFSKTNVHPPIVDVRTKTKVKQLPDISRNDHEWKPRYNAWASDTYPRTLSGRAKRPRTDQKQENFRSPEELVSETRVDRMDSQSLTSLQRRLELTTQLCHTLMRDQQGLSQLLQSAGLDKGTGVPSHVSQSTTLTPPTTENAMAAYTQQLIQQQMQLGLQQCQQLICQQQMEIRSLQARFVALGVDSQEFHLPPAHFLTNFTPISPSPLMTMASVQKWDDKGMKKAKEEKQITKKTKPRKVPKLELDEIKKKAEAKKTESVVCGRKFPSGDRASAAASLASKITPANECSASSSRPAYQPGLSAMISGTSFLNDELSLVSSVRHGDTGSLPSSPQKRTQTYRNDDTSGGVSLFEALRENIYSEVASLISQNEGRPHYLIELFRELQLLNSDYLRQRALYALKDLITSTLNQEDDKADQDEEEEEEEEDNSVRAAAPAWMKSGQAMGSDQTPSESLFTSDYEDSPAKPSTVRKANEHEVTAQVHAACDADHDATYDYMEDVENMSSLSTPTSTSGAWDGPFAQDSLGDTVIHLDKAMARMREYERKLSEGLGSATEGSPLFRRQSQQQQLDGDDKARSSSSALDQGNDSSESDAQPHIDTRQLDTKIKNIMTQVIPILKTHMEDTCNSDLLSYMKTVILALAQQRGDEHDHRQFFHKQLSRLIQDTLMKYEGRKMVECVEDLVVDISEILFSELAFYHLMRGLDEAKVKVVDQPRPNISVTSSDVDTLSDGLPMELASSSKPGPSYRGRLIEYETTSEEGGQDEQDDQLDKARDDELAAAVNIDSDAADDQSEEQTGTDMPYSSSIQLAPSETKPFNRIGSDEDDESSENDDDSLSDKDRFDTAVSREKEADSSKETLKAEELEGVVEIDLPTDEPKMANGDIGEEFIAIGNLPVKSDLNQEELLMKQAMDEAQSNTALQAAIALSESDNTQLPRDDTTVPEEAVIE